MESYGRCSILIVYILVALCISDSRAKLTRNCEVTIDQGTLKGLTLKTKNGREVAGFLGVPFAEPPVGKLRFTSPKPAGKWTGIYNATEQPSMCVQYNEGELEGDEDCLYLNVFIPKLSEKKEKNLLPVMVFLHGGYLSKGTIRDKHPTYLLDHDIILVAPAYRLDVLGFFSTGDIVVPGNYGLKDQIMALQWVQKNIEAFGGDPHRVTIFGQSAGSASVNVLTLSERAQGLFSKFIMMSGTAISPQMYRASSYLKKLAKTVGEELNCPSDSSAELVECMRGLSASKIMEATRDKTLRNDLNNWKVTDEPKSDEAVITGNPRKLVKEGKMKNAPWISGVVRDDGLLETEYYFTHREEFNKKLQDFNDFISYWIIPGTIRDQDNFLKVAKEYFFNDLTADENVLLKNLTDFIGDWRYAYPEIELVETQQCHSNAANAYVYSFEYRSKSSSTIDIIVDGVHVGVGHGDELPFIFGKSPLDKDDEEIVEKMTKLWTSFAASNDGVPTLDTKDGVEWKPYGEKGNYLQIGDERKTSLTIKTCLKGKRLRFWRDFNVFVPV